MAALDLPEIVITSATASTDPVDVSRLQIRGTVTRVAPITAKRGWKIDVLATDGAVASVTVHSQMANLPDVLAGDEIWLTANDGMSISVRIDDRRGALFFLFRGETLPTTQKDDPFTVEQSFDRHYIETLTTDNLCQWTVVHSSLTLHHDRQNTRIPPGDSRIIEVDGARFMAVVFDAVFPDESDCEADAPQRIAYSWSRLPAGQ